MNRRLTSAAIWLLFPSCVVGQSLPLGTRVGSEISMPSPLTDEPADDPGAERDPFVRETTARAPEQPTRRPPSTLAAVKVAEVSATAIVRTPSGNLVVLAVADGPSFVARRGDRLQDAVVSSVDAGVVTFALSAASRGETSERRETMRALRRPVSKETR